jgi:hypothetical protein
MSNYFPQEESGAEYPGHAQLKARIAALKQLVEAKNEALRVFSPPGFWSQIRDGHWAWLGKGEPWPIAQAALDLREKPDGDS